MKVAIQDEERLISSHILFKLNFILSKYNFFVIFLKKYYILV